MWCLFVVQVLIRLAHLGMAIHICFLVANAYTQKSIDLDPGIGSSVFGVCISELDDRITNTLRAKEYPRPDINEVTSTITRLFDGYDIRFENHWRALVDTVNVSFIWEVKDKVNEDSIYEQQIASFKKSYTSVYDLQFLQQDMIDFELVDCYYSNSSLYPDVSVLPLAVP